MHTRRFVSRSLLLKLAYLLASGLLLSGASPCQVNGMRTFANRIEGTTIQKNAKDDFTLISIERSFKPFPPSSILNVRFYLPVLQAGKNVAVFLEAQELQDSLHYFMEARNFTWKMGDWNSFKPWPTSDVIDQLGLDSNNIGIRAGYQRGSNPPVFLPVDVAVETANITSSGSLYTSHLITGEILQAINISVFNDSGMPVNLKLPRLGCDVSIAPKCIKYPSGGEVVFDLDFSSLPAGQYHIMLSGDTLNTNEKTSLDIKIYHHPPGV
jgi:hypothetical protein